MGIAINVSANVKSKKPKSRKSSYSDILWASKVDNAIGKEAQNVMFEQTNCQCFSVFPSPPLRVCFHCDVEETHVRVSCRTSQTIRVSPVTSQTCDLLCLVPPSPLLHILLHHSTHASSYLLSNARACHIRRVTPTQHVMLSITQNLCNSCYNSSLTRISISLVFPPALHHILPGS